VLNHAQNMKKVKDFKHYDRCARAVNTLQQLLARHRSVMGAFKYAVGSSCGYCKGRYYWQFFILRVFRGDSTAL